MSNPAPLHHHFFGGVFSLSFLIAIGFAPVIASDWATPTVLLGLLICIVAFSALACYQWLFVSKRPVTSTMNEYVILLTTLHPFAFGIHHWTPLTKNSQLIETMNWWENINLVFGIAVLLISSTAAYSIARNKSNAYSTNSSQRLEWTLFYVDLQTCKYGRLRNFPILHKLFWPLAFGGIVYLAWFAISYSHPEHIREDLKLIVLIGICSMMLCYLTGLVIGEGIRLIQLEQQLGKDKFEIDGFEHLLRWRHDYVKYHLPAQIRKLNLRLFNQHIEAYERLQNE